MSGGTRWYAGLFPAWWVTALLLAPTAAALLRLRRPDPAAPGPTADGRCGGASPHILWSFWVAPMVASQLCVALFAAVDAYADATGRLQRWRARQKGHRPLPAVSWRSVARGEALTVYNATLSALWPKLLVYWPLYVWRGLCDADAGSDGPAALALRLAASLLLADLIFYTSHRLNHAVPWLYHNVHKRHHEWVHSYGSAFSACHPLESLLCNEPTVMLPPILAGLPPPLFTLWTVAATCNSVFSHSGYVVRGLPFGADPHDWHHHHQRCEFGAGGWCDRLLRTRYADVYGGGAAARAPGDLEGHGG